MRTFLVGEAPEAAVKAAKVVRDAVEAARAAIRPGVLGRDVYAAAADVVEAAGYRTQRTEDGGVPEDGFQASLGHGVGLAVHEEPGLGLAGHSPLVAGDVVTIEPGIFVPEIGEVCFEDLILVTEDGAETLTDFPYDLTPGT
jgi:Xaa-Pro aminopeptidase